ncbi:MAG: hypothetical protein ACT4TC_09040 [Myxococcaceae bacterium]
MVQLRKQVAEAAELAEIKTKRDALISSRDRSLRDLGSRIYEQVKQGKLRLPPNLMGALTLVDATAKEVEKHVRDINDLLREGEEVSARMRRPQIDAKSTVAGKTKKR